MANAELAILAENQLVCQSTAQSPVSNALFACGALRSSHTKKGAGGLVDRPRIAHTSVRVNPGHLWLHTRRFQLNRRGRVTGSHLLAICHVIHSAPPGDSMTCSIDPLVSCTR